MSDSVRIKLGYFIYLTNYSIHFREIYHVKVVDLLKITDYGRFSYQQGAYIFLVAARRLQINGR